MFSGFWAWLCDSPRPQPVITQGVPAPANAQDDPVKSDRAWVQYLRDALAFIRPRSIAGEERSYAIRSLKMPKPFPGVVPEGGPSMAMDTALTTVANFGASYGWDGYGFMGYALLADLTQIPEFRKPCEILANEMTRKWGRVVSTSGEDDEADKTEILAQIEADLRKFRVQEVFREAFECDNFFGRGQIFIDLGTTGDELKSALIPSVKVSKGSLVALRLIEPMWTYPNLYNAIDPLAPNFYQPKTWFVMGTEVHTSRILTFISRPVPDMLKPAYMFGGLSLIQLMKPYVERWLRTVNSVSDITHNFSTPVLKTTMSQTTTKGGAESLALRAQVYNATRDNQGLLVCDKDKEDFVIASAPLSGLDKLQAQAQEQMAAIAGIPIVKYFGITPSGLNASSDGEIRVFNDTIESLQEREGTPMMKTVLEVIQLNRFGRVDPDIDWAWEPLWSLSELDGATVRKTEADTAAVLIEAGVISPAEDRKRVAADPDSPYASLDIKEVPAAATGEEGDDGDGDFEGAGMPNLGAISGQMSASDPREQRQDRSRDGVARRPQDRQRDPAEREPDARVRDRG